MVIDRVKKYKFMEKKKQRRISRISDIMTDAGAIFTKLLRQIHTLFATLGLNILIFLRIKVDFLG
jgi:hypothetical protein